MDRTRVIEHKGKHIILLDFAGIIDVEEGLAAVAEARRFVTAQPADGTSVTLTDVRDTHYDRRIVEAFKEMTTANRPFVKAAAVVSNSAIHQAAIAMVALFSRRKIQVFDSRERALDWLVAQT
jgi:hypothetical protein